MARSRTILCLADAEKGQAFLREIKERGFRVVLLTRNGLAGAGWPRDAIDELHTIHELNQPRDLMDFVLWLARGQTVDAVVGLDEFDTTRAAQIREMLRLDGMTLSQALRWRDKLAMRGITEAAGVPVPPYVGFHSQPAVRAFLARVPGPWLVKPRMLAGSLGIRTYDSAREVLDAFERMGHESVNYLLEQFIPGPLYHIDGVVDGGRVRFAQAHRYGRPLLQVAHQGGVFTSATVERGTRAEAALQEAHARVVGALGLERGVTHAEFIEDAEGRFVFVETACRVGGAHLSDLIEATCGLNLWREWARLTALAPGEAYELPPVRSAQGGLALCLARQKHPDYAAYSDPEIHLKIEHEHHAGLVVTTSTAARAEELIRDYVQRFTRDFLAVLPAGETGVGIDGPTGRALFRPQ
jgi:biotin carboxylase